LIDDRARDLRMAVLDDEHTPADLAELEALAARSPDVREAWTRLQRVKEATRAMAWQDPPPETWDRYWTSVYARTERRIGWLLVIAGLLLLAGWQLWTVAPALWRDVFQDESIPLAIRGAFVAVGLGAVILVWSVVREQLTVRRKDRYDKGVIR
jgi:ferric-dicitrate binding protein FerR (iron transport regulator)